MALSPELQAIYDNSQLIPLWTGDEEMRLTPHLFAAISETVRATLEGIVDYLAAHENVYNYEVGKIIFESDPTFNPNNALNENGLHKYPGVWQLLPGGLVVYSADKSGQFNCGKDVGSKGSGGTPPDSISSLKWPPMPSHYHNLEPHRHLGPTRPSSPDKLSSQTAQGRGYETGYAANDCWQTAGAVGNNSLGCLSYDYNGAAPTSEAFPEDKWRDGMTLGPGAVYPEYSFTKTNSHGTDIVLDVRQQGYALNVWRRVS